MKTHKIALFGGAFNPTGLHHEKIANCINEEMDMRVWFMPCHQHHFSKNSDLIDESHRLNMAQLAANNIPGAVSFDFEIRHKIKGSTFDTMLKLELEMPQIDFHLVIGLDNANVVVKRWYHGSKIIQQYPFIIVNRSGVKPNVTWYCNKPHKFLNIDDNQISSTDIRTAIKDKRYDYAQSLVNPKVWDYITKHKLFGYENA